MPKTIRVLARANLTLLGVLIPVYDTALVEDSDEVQQCIAMQLLVPENPDGSFDDLGPVGIQPTPPGVRCCGK